jgi:hypothetical protein
MTGTSLSRRALRSSIASELGVLNDGLLHRADLRARGVSRHDVRTEVLCGRWERKGRHTVRIGEGDLTGPALLRWAVWESGSGAMLDGAAALVAQGMTGLALNGIDVSIPRNNRRWRLPGVRVRYRSVMPPATEVGIRRVRVPQAAVNAALWARSDREAALILCLALQQRLLRPEDLALAWRARRHGRHRPGLDRIVADLTDGARSLGELDFARRCRCYGLPAPTRQVVRPASGGRVYLDAAWEDIGLVVEVDGGHHALALHTVEDAFRQNEIALGSETVLRLPVLALRLHERRFMEQVVRAYAVLCHQRSA